MAYLEPKGEEAGSLPGKQRPCPGLRVRVLGDSRVAKVCSLCGMWLWRGSWRRRRSPMAVSWSGA